MGTQATGRIAVLSIHPEYAASILAGTKTVEFRKRRLAEDISLVLVYATLPVGKVVGAFTIAGYDVGSPTAVWERNKSRGGITRRAFRSYFSQEKTAVGIVVDHVAPLREPVPLTALPGITTPPQSFVYLSAEDVPHLIRSAFDLECAVPEASAAAQMLAP